MQTIQVELDQSLMDIAVQEYGDVSRVFDLVSLNGLKGITDNIYLGQELKVDEVTIANRQRVAYMQMHRPIATIKQEDKACGIGFWAIGIDFEVNG